MPTRTNRRPRPSQGRYNQIVNFLTAQRKLQGLTLRELAHRSGYDFSTIGYMERGQNQQLLTTVIDIANALGYDLILCPKSFETHETNLDLLSDFDRSQIYNGLDTLVTHDVFAAIYPQLDDTTAATYAFSRALQAPTLEMRIRGVLIDQVRRSEVIEELTNQSDILEQRLNHLVLEGVGLPGFNYRSHDHLRDLFYNRLGIHPILKLGRPTTDRGAREKLAVYTIATALVNLINVLTEIGDRISVLRTALDPDGRIRTSYNIAGTSTGRFSSSLSEFGTGGNLQNIEESLRSVLIADPGYKFAKADAKSGESYCVGAIEWNRFNDGTYLDAVESGDIHTSVARLVWPDLGWTGQLQTDRRTAEQPFYRGHSISLHV